MSETIEPRPCRMFPLGSVVVPHAPLPLHIFEPRYQELLNQSLEDDRTFAVVLISRGREVGGGDQRNSVGTIVHIEDYNRFDDGRAAVVTRGVSRIEVVDWLPDDPYPRALVRDRPDAPGGLEDRNNFDDAVAALDQLLDLAERAGRLPDRPEIEWVADVGRAAWQLATLAPITEIDRYRVLAKDSVLERCALLAELLRDRCIDIELMEELDGD